LTVTSTHELTTSARRGHPTTPPAAHFAGAQESPHRLAVLPDVSRGQFVITAGGSF
jgi:hypothetical protein